MELILIAVAIACTYFIYEYKKTEKERSVDNTKEVKVVEPRDPPVEAWEVYLHNNPDVYKIPKYRSPEGAREHYDSYGKSGGRVWGTVASQPDSGYPSISIMGGGFVFKPVSEGDHKLVILFPKSYPDNMSVVFNGEVGKDTGRTNGERPTFRFSKPGKSYPKNSVLIVNDKRYNVSDPSNRVG